MNKQRIVVTTTAVLAALAMAACSAESDGVPATATTTASTTVVRPAVETATPTPTVSTAEKYENVTGQGDIRRGSADRQFGLGSPVPGAEIATFDKEDRVKPEGCTLGPAVNAGGRTGFVTAGHCSVPGAPETYVAIGPGTDDTVLLGTPESVLVSPTDDSAVIWTDTAAGIDRIAGTWPIDGAMPLEELARLVPGDWICINGTESGVECAEFIRMEEGTRIVTGTLAEDGDSGSTMFVVDAVTHRATLIGVVSRGGEGARTTATALAPALTRIGAEAITDR